MSKHIPAFIICVTWLIVEPIVMCAEMALSDVGRQRINRVVNSFSSSSEKEKIVSSNAKEPDVLNQSNASNTADKTDVKSSNRSFCEKIRKIVDVGSEKTSLVLFDYLYSDINGLFQRILGKRYHYKGYVRTKGNSLVPCEKITQQDNDNIEDLKIKFKRFQSFLNQEGIRFLYVHVPRKNCKYVDQRYPVGSIGITLKERKADKFLQFCELERVDYIDLREQLFNTGKNWEDAFYKTDHHWKAETGFWAFQIVANYLKEQYGFSFDEQIVQDSSYNREPFYKENVFLGSYGYRVGGYFCGVLDSITKISPKFETCYSKINDTSEICGSFEEICLSEEKLLPKKYTTFELHTAQAYDFYGGNGTGPMCHTLNLKASNNKKYSLYAILFQTFLSHFCMGSVKRCLK